MAKRFIDVNTDFNSIDPLDVFTGAKAITQEPAKKAAAEKPKAKRSGSTASKEKKEGSKISIELKREAKTKRATLLLKASTYDKIAKSAEKYSISFNDLVSQILDKVEL